ncbi:short chain fatty acid transporter [Moraxella macacae 0408225]|uniref:Short chain fatty acid transporter n=1 Tax=Moraxella macacae 0408225 TaxID=1230338 RepID=L2F800_9GAMM|nr:short-chain fatty acid transporter [Moraxella macacae]ELA09189.1 short chain fatty acid transporter [Moraxella macacae 0408225]
MIRALTDLSVKIVKNYLPSPFVFCSLLSIAVYAAVLIFTNQTPIEAAKFWGDGLWSLLGFSMQMALILVTGHVLAKAPMIGKLLDSLAARVKSPKQAIVAVTVVSLIGCWINWGFGLIVGAVFAKSLARQVKGVDYPLLVASAYSGFLIWHGGLSGSIPLSLATNGADLVRLSGETITSAIPVSQTLFSPLNLVIIAGLFIGLPVINMLMLPKNPIVADLAKLQEPIPNLPLRDTPAQKLDDNRFIALIVVAIAAVYLFGHFANNGFNLALNIVIALFLFAGLLAHKTPERYSRAIEDSIQGIAGIVLLFPFYGGIMGLMMGANEGSSSLANQISNAFVAISNEHTFPALTFLSAGLVNIFVPSGGGQWAVQGPIMLPAGAALGVSPVTTAMAIAWGDAWTNMIQPFWALPLLGIVGLDARAIMGYCLMALGYSGILICGVFILFG